MSKFQNIYAIMHIIYTHNIIQPAILQSYIPESITTVTVSDNGPSPSTLVAYTCTSMIVDREQTDENMRNTWLQTPFSQEEAGIETFKQVTLEVESE